MSEDLQSFEKEVETTEFDTSAEQGQQSSSSSEIETDMEIEEPNDAFPQGMSITTEQNQPPLLSIIPRSPISAESSNSSNSINRSSHRRDGRNGRNGRGGRNNRGRNVRHPNLVQVPRNMLMPVAVGQFSQNHPQLGMGMGMGFGIGFGMERDSRSQRQERQTLESDESDNHDQQSPINMDKIFRKDMKPYFSLDSRPKPTNYVEMCDSSIQKLSELKMKNEENEEFDSVIKNLSAIKQKLKRLMDIGIAANKRDLMIGSFCSTSEKIIGITPSTNGSFDRKCFEMTRALGDLYDDDVYGNVIGSEITFAFGPNGPIVISYMEALSNTTERSIDKRLIFGSYRLDKVRRSNMQNVVDGLNEQSVDSTQFTFDLIMTDVDTKNSILCHATTEMKKNIVFRMQDIDKTGTEIFSALTDLVHRRAVSKVNFTKIVKKLTRVMPRYARVAYWNDILNFIDKEMSIMNSGYDYVDAGDNYVFKISLEEHEACNITAIPAPYLNIEMMCGHIFSLPAVYGLVNEGACEDTESIRCPMCRDTLIPIMIPVLSKEDQNKVKTNVYTKSDLLCETDDSCFSLEQNETKLNKFPNIGSGISKLKSTIDSTAPFDVEDDSSDDNENIGDDESNDSNSQNHDIVVPRMSPWQ